MGTVMIEIIADMIRIADSVKIRLMAGKTGLRSIHITAGMALNTGQGEMGAGQRKSCLVMIKNCRLPAGRAVTDCAVMVEVIADMIRFADSVEIGGVTGKTFRRCVVVPGAVALGAT